MKTISFRNDILPLKNALYRLALRITLNPQDAEDTVQDTLIKVWNRRDDWNSIDNIEAYAMTICRNLSLDKLKKAESNNTTLEEGIARQTPLSSPYEHTEQRDLVSLVRKLIDELPEKQRSCMQLRDFEGKPYKEIATILGITEEQVKVNIYRARQTIKQKYQQIEGYGL